LSHFPSTNPNAYRAVKDFDPVCGTDKWAPNEWPPDIPRKLELRLRKRFPGGLKIAVFLPALTTLQTQTDNRLNDNHPDLVDWGCTLGNGCNTVMFYSVKERKRKGGSDDSRKSYEHLMSEIRKKKTTLFLIIADECHRGVLVKGAEKDEVITKDESGAHHRLLNNRDISTRRNVIIADVSATPYVLLFVLLRSSTCSCRLILKKLRAIEIFSVV
jgi:hypothetical protein